MKISFTSLKVSIAGAKLSHLVQKDKIWDHGTMVEQVKNIFYKIEKAKSKSDPQLVKKNMTREAYLELVQFIHTRPEKSISKNAILTEVSIIEVKEKNHKSPDRFTALLKGKRKHDEGNSIINFLQHWQFIREGDWWLLEEMK